jgi:hypothetical protein
LTVTVVTPDAELTVLVPVRFVPFAQGLTETLTV